MALDTNFNVNPYYDDFNEDKKYLRLLFKPGYAVQARELTQTQTLLQNQIERFGNHIFKNGSVVSGGQFFFQTCSSIKLDTTYAGTDIDITEFDGKTVFSADDVKRAQVLVAYDSNPGNGDPKTLLVKPIYGNTFTNLETIKTDDASPSLANISSNGVSFGQVFSISEGVFYYDGFFIKNDAQSIAVSKYSNYANGRIGFEITESVVTNNSDTSLLDPAQNASNYQAPGSDRYKIELVLAVRSLDSIDDTKFIELMRVENGKIIKENKYPIYSVLEDTLARRTYDESGNYTVRPFNLNLEDNTSNTAQTNVILSPGKGYIFGYEYETNSPTTIKVDKPRTTANAQNKRINADYGNFIYTTNHYGSLPFNNLQTVDLHCVNLASINTTSTSSISNTKIGTVRVKSLAYDSASNTSDGQTYVYQTFLFDVNVGSITGNVNSATSNTITIGNTTAGQIYTSVSDAYVGSKIRISSGAGSSELPKIITGFNVATQTITVDSNYTTTPNNASVWSIDFEFNDTESLANYSSTTLVGGANISSRSKDPATPYDDAFLTDSATECLVFPLGQNYISQNSISDMSFSYRKLYASQAFSSSESPSLTLGSGETLSSGSTTSSRAVNYYVTVTTQGTSPYSAGSVIPVDKFTVDTGTNRITVTSGNNMVANIVATIDVSSATRKNKTYVAANSEMQVSGGVDVFGNNAVIIYPTQGQTHIANTYIAKIPGTTQSLFVSDVIEITEILDFGGLSITEANSAIATNVTTKYIFDNGQRDSFYDHSSIRLKTGVTPPIGPLSVSYNRFTSTGAGFFTVDSYLGVNYVDIPEYSSTKTDQKFNLRDCIDFRPVRADATASGGSTVTFSVDSTTTGPKIPENGSDVILDYAYYLGRIDKVVLDKSRRFEIIKGIPSLNPEAPNDSKTGMTLFILNYLPYVTDTTNISVQQIQNKRYTMRDIGNIEKRVENLEYYTSLSLLEQDTVTKQDLTILDSQNLPRFKNGIVVDGFKGHSVADVTNTDYLAAIDPVSQELRPSFDISAHRLKFDAANSTNYIQVGNLVSANYSAVPLIDQSKASKAVNVNPFNVTNFLGKIKLTPQSDIWVDVTAKPDVLVNVGGDRDAWQFLANSAFQYEWNSWNTVWTGVASSTTEQWQGFLLNTTVTTTTTQNQTRSGILTQVVPEAITTSIGNRVVDVSIIPFMRAINVLFTGSNFRPNRALFPFFDNKSVANTCGPTNKFVLTANNITFNFDLTNPEVIQIRNKDTNTSNGTCLGVLASNNILYVTNVSPNSSFDFANCQLVGSQTGATYNVASYSHLGGTVYGATANTLTLRTDASGISGIASSNSYVGSVININQGIGQGQTRTITSYNASSKVITVDSNWTTTPVANQSFYSIGGLESDETGTVAGILRVPSGTFRVGEKLFRLIDSSTGDIPSSTTNGDVSFFAQGLLQTREETIVSTIAPRIQRLSVTDNRVLTSAVSTTTTQDFTPAPADAGDWGDAPVATTGWFDPVSETFLISPLQYPEGVYISKIRFCFKTKDPIIPVTLEIRPTVNGYPSSSVVYPFSTVTLTPDKVKVSDSPNMDDASKYTDFVFDSPVYLQPGEHCFVLLANSNKYEVYVADIGALDLVTNRQISEQPYGGSFFLSQNGSTWTPEQGSDIMFRLYRNQYDTNVSTAQFLIDTPSEKLQYSVLQLITSEISLPNTSLSYEFNSEISSGGFSGFQPITPLSNYEIIDANGMRVLSNTTGNTTFTLKSTLRSSTPMISPSIDITRAGIIAIGNRINNLEISNDDIIIANSGSGYANSSDVTVTISGGGGSGATAVANVVANTIDAIYITAGGSGYTSSPTITITPGSGGGSGATAIYNGETEKNGGNAIARYLTRRVTLADGFDSGDLRVYLTAHKPAGTNIHIYYKLLSGSDPDLFEDKKWQLMTQIGNQNYFSINETDYRELTFAPGVNGIADNSVSYTSGSTAYTQFKTFAIKVVMTSSNSAVVPRVRDFRAIAFPAG